MTIFNTTKSTSGPYAMPGVGDGQSGKIMAATYTWATALLINDVIQSPLIQKGSVIVDVMVVTDSMGSGAVTLDVGYGGDPDYFAAASTTGVAGGVIRASAITAKPLTLLTNDTVDVTIKVAPTGAVAAGTISITVFFLPMNT
jgi:hypothetical protein